MDGDCLTQYSEDGSERLFKDIDQEKLKEFVIYDDKEEISVNLLDGTFRLNDTYLTVPKLEGIAEPRRLIYFRRNRINIGTKGVIESRSVESFIGYQVTIDGKNNKIMFSKRDGKFNIHVE